VYATAEATTMDGWIVPMRAVVLRQVQKTRGELQRLEQSLAHLEGLVHAQFGREDSSHRLTNPGERRSFRSARSRPNRIHPSSAVEAANSGSFAKILSPSANFPRARNERASATMSARWLKWGSAMAIVRQRVHRANAVLWEASALALATLSIWFLFDLVAP
jgi:hypothetical protein